MLQEAQKLLVDTNMSVSKIMEQLDVSNKSFFYQIFQKEFNATPSEYRQKNQAKPQIAKKVYHNKKENHLPDNNYDSF